MSKLSERVRIAVVGLGWVGQEVARAALEDPRVTLVGVVDADPSKAGRDLGEILGEGRLGVLIEADARDLLLRVRPEVAVVATTSDLRALMPTLELCLASGAHTITTCENLASPDLVDPNFARVLDGLARERGVVVLATGVNPGFAMDRLPVLLSQSTRNIRRVRVVRVVDAASRRAQLQAKAGIGLSPRAFAEALTVGRVGHQGLLASLRLVAKGLGVALERTTETVRPLIAETPSESSVLGPVAAGEVRGLYQVARGYRGASEFITLELIIALDEHRARDAIDIIGEPPLHFEGELSGDQATVAAVLSAIPLVVNMGPGLRTVLDLPAEQPEEPAPAERPQLRDRVHRDETTIATLLPAGRALTAEAPLVAELLPARPSASEPGETPSAGSRGAAAKKSSSSAAKTRGPKIEATTPARRTGKPKSAPIEPEPAPQPESAAHPKAAARPKPATQPKAVAKPKPATQPKAVAKPKGAKEPKAKDRATPARATKRARRAPARR